MPGGTAAASPPILGVNRLIPCEYMNLVSPNSPKISFSPHLETYWSRIMQGWIVRNFQILIVFAIEICKLSPNSFSFWRTSSPDPYRGFAPGPNWRTSVSQTPWAIAPKWKFIAPSLLPKIHWMLVKAAYMRSFVFTQHRGVTDRRTHRQNCHS